MLTGTPSISSHRRHFNWLALAGSVSSPAYGLLPRSTASTVARVLAAGPSGSVALSSNVVPALDPTPRHRSKAGAGGATVSPVMGNMNPCGGKHTARVPSRGYASTAGRREPKAHGPHGLIFSPGNDPTGA